MGLTITHKNTYKKDGKIGNVYFLQADSEKDLELYKQIKGENFQTDEQTGKPLFFSNRLVANGTALKLVENKEGKKDFYPDDTESMKMESAIGSISDPTLRKTVAEAYLDRLMGK